MDVKKIKPQICSFNWNPSTNFPTCTKGMQFQGYLAGNPLTSYADSNFSILFSHGMGIISDELYEVSSILHDL